MDIQIDPQDKSYGKPGPLNPGSYLAMISDAEFKMSSSGRPMVVVYFQIIEPESEHIGKTTDKQFYMLDQKKSTAWYVDLCRAANPQLGRHNPSQPGVLKKELCYMPLRIRVEMEDEEWEGNNYKRARVRGHYPLTEEEEDILERQYGEYMVPPRDLANPNESKQKSGASKSRRRRNEEDDNLPF